MQRRRVDGSVDGTARMLDDGHDALKEMILRLGRALLWRGVDERVLGWNRVPF